MNSTEFLNEVNRIFRIVLIQKIVQMTLRAAWVGGAVYLFCWGVNRLWGWLPDQRTWSLIASLVSILIFGSAFLVTNHTKRFVWRLDRKYYFQEQVYTLYEVLQDSNQDISRQPGVRPLLGSDHIKKLPAIRREIVDKGWRIREEFESTIVVLILLMIVYLFNVNSIVNIHSGGGIGILPVLGNDPTADQIFSAGIPGYEGGGVDGGSEIISSEGDIAYGPLDFSPMEWAQVTSLMHDLGERLSETAGTYELGQALAQDNYKEAANQFSNLAENADDLSPEIQIQFANHLLETAVKMQDLGQGQVSDYFQEASAALFNGSNPKISEEMDDLSTLMEFFSQFQSRDIRSTMNEDAIGQFLQPLEQYQNNLFKIEEVADLPDYVSSPGGTNLNAEEILGEGLDFIMPFDGSIIEGVWLPFQYSLDDSDVVSSYFSPR